MQHINAEIKKSLHLKYLNRVFVNVFQNVTKKIHDG